MATQLLGVAVLIAAIAALCFTRDGLHLIDVAGEAIVKGLDSLRTGTRQTICSVRGHNDVLHYEGAHVCLLCTNCWRETPGWSPMRSASVASVRPSTTPRS